MSDYRRNLAWKAGAKAARSGKSIDTNNRQPCTIFYDDWCDGYRHEEDCMFRENGVPSHERVHS